MSAYFLCVFKNDDVVNYGHEQGYLFDEYDGIIEPDTYLVTLCMIDITGKGSFKGQYYEGFKSIKTVNVTNTKPVMSVSFFGTVIGHTMAYPINKKDTKYIQLSTKPKTLNNTQITKLTRIIKDLEMCKYWIKYASKNFKSALKMTE